MRLGFFRVELSWLSKQLRQATYSIYDQSSISCHKEHPFAEKEVLDYHDFQQQKYLYIASEDKELQYSNYFMRQLSKNNIQIEVAERTDNIESILFMLDVNMGFTVIPEYFLDRFRGSSQIVVKRIETESYMAEFLAFWSSNNKNKALKLFLSSIKDRFEEIAETDK